MDTVESELRKSLENQWFNEAIRLFVFAHPDVVSLSDAAIEGNPRCKYIVDGFYWYISEELRGAIWPVCYRLEDHIWQYQTPPIEWHMGHSYHLADLNGTYGIYEDGEPLPEVRQAFEALASRLNGFLNLFRSGVLVAWGQNGQDRALRPVDKRLWNDPHFFFRLDRSGASFEEFCHGRYKLLFLNLKIRSRGWSPDNEQGTASDKPKNKGGRPPEYDWDGLTRYLMGIANSPDGLPDKKSEIVELSKDWFEGQNDSHVPGDTTIKDRLSKVLP